MKQLTHLISCLVLTLLIFSCERKKPADKPSDKNVSANYLNESEEDFDQRMAWWRSDRFGMFIHWGVYSIPSGIYQGDTVQGIGEWIMKFGKIPVDNYEAIAKTWNPTSFDADRWVSLMKNAGMKYVVITSKHHDGFCLWDSELTEYDIVNFTPYGQDILQQLSEACKRQGIKFGLYHSIMDWHHPLAQRNFYLEDKERNETSNKEEFAQYLEEYLKPQLKELIQNYDPAILWFDGEWVAAFTHEQGQDLYQYVRSLKPDILINNRVDKGRQGMQGMNKVDQVYAGDFGTPEQEILAGTSTFDWEACMTMNDTWGFKNYDDNWKSSAVLIHNLIDVTAKGGNYLLNVGPTPEGLIPEPSVERLEQIGDWLNVNGEAIYNTERLAGNYKQDETIWYTRKKNQPIYFGISIKTPGETINFAYLEPEDGSEVYMLGAEEPLDWDYDDSEGLTVTVPESARKLQSIAWVFKITGKEVNNGYN